MRRAGALLILLSLALGLTVYALRIDAIKVDGVHTISARTIIERSGLHPGQRILWERLTVAERRIEEIPAVADVVAERSLPSTVILHVFEREPIARLDGARELAVDHEGAVFPVGEATVEPVLYGWKAARKVGRAKAGARLDADSRTVLEVMPKLSEFLRQRARKLRLADGAFTITLLSGTEIRFGVLRDLEAKAAVAEAVLLQERDTKLAYVDVRSPSVPVARPQESPGATPAPTPEPTPVPAPR